MANPNETPEERYLSGAENDAYSLRKYEDRAQLPSQGGEAVEVVAYLNTASGEVVKYGPTLMDWDDEQEPVESLMTVAQHQRILLSTVIRCEQKGAFKTCLECGYQDGHDLICQYHESKRAAVSDDLTNVRCLCCQSEHAHNSYDAGFIAGSGMCQACDSALPAKDIVSTTHPADQVADDLTMVKVSRELLERAAKHLSEGRLDGPSACELRTILEVKP